MARLRWTIGLLMAVAVAVLLNPAAQAQRNSDKEQCYAACKKGAALAAQGRYDQAIKSYQKGAALAPGAFGANDPNTAAIQNNLALLYKEMGDYAKAEPLSLKALAIYKLALGENHPAYATSLNNLAMLYKEMGDYAKAEPLYKKALVIDKKALGEDHPAYATDLNNLAGLYYAQGDYARARALFQKALAIRKKALGEQHPDYAQSLNNLAGLYCAQGAYAKAEPLFLKALALRKQSLGEQHPHYASSLNNLAWLYKAQGAYAKAESLYKKALAIHKQALGEQHPDYAQSLNNLAGLYCAQGAYAQAEPLFLKVLAILKQARGEQHPHYAANLNNLAVLWGRLGRWDEVADTTDRTRRILRHHVSRILPVLSEAKQLTFLRTNHEAEFHMALSLALLRHQVNPGLATQSTAWLLNGKAVAQQALAERTLLARDRTDPRAKKTSQQLLVIRQELAALTFAPFKPGQQRARRQRLAQLTDQEQELSKQLAQARGQSPQDDPWVDLSMVRRALSRDATLIEIARFDVWNFQAKGKERHWQPARYAAWVIPPHGQGAVRLIDLGPAARIEAAVKAVRQALQAAPADIRRQGELDSERQLRQPLTALARLVLHPIYGHIGQARHWVLSPDASLWLVPWAALPLPDGRYAIEKHHLHYVISGRDLVAGPTKGKTGRALVLADPDYDLKPAEARSQTRDRQEKRPPELRSALPKGGLPRVRRLPGTAQEARAILPHLARYARLQPRLYTGKRALEGIFKAAERPRVVVLSTHGFFLEDQDEAVAPLPADRSQRGMKMLVSNRPRPRGKNAPVLENPLLRCGLLLAGCNRRQETLQATGDDGVLTGLEIVGCDLRGCELVVLSACDTGLGEVHNGEGVAGLRQAFQLAGAHSVLATLWQIPDRDTARLMRDFFAQLAAGQSKADALRQAQLALIKARRARYGAAHPFFWAAFTLTGQ